MGLLTINVLIVNKDDFIEPDYVFTPTRFDCTTWNPLKFHSCISNWRTCNGKT